MIINPYTISNAQVNNHNNNQKTNQQNHKSDIDIKKTITKIINNLIAEHTELLVNKDKNILVKNVKKYIKNIDVSISDKELESLTQQILDKIFGYDILQKYIDGKEVTDIRVVSYNQIYIKEKEKWRKTKDTFKSEQEFEDFVRHSVLKNGAVINFEDPIVLVSDRNNHIRIEAGISPVSVCGPSICMRLHKINEELDLEHLMVKHNMFNAEVYDFLIKALNNQKNIIICGKGGSGKTTLLRAMIKQLPPDTPITTNEETAEFYIGERNIIQREIVDRKDSTNSIDLEKLTRHSLVMSNDVIVVGELKGKEANVFFDAISTGHAGYATLHADSVNNTISRIIVLIKKDIKAQGYTENFLESFLADTIDYIIYLKDYSISEIANVKYNRKEKQIELNKLFVRKQISKEVATLLSDCYETQSYILKIGETE